MHTLVSALILTSEAPEGIECQPHIPPSQLLQPRIVLKSLPRRMSTSTPRALCPHPLRSCGASLPAAECFRKTQMREPEKKHPRGLHRSAEL